jgi:hypothetical protein
MTGSEELEYWPSDLPSDFVPGDVAAYEVAVSQLSGGSNLLIAGQPSVTMSIHQLMPTGFREQLNLRLFDVKPDGSMSIVTRGTYTIDSGDPLQPIRTMTLTVPTYGNLWEAGASDVLRLEITNVDTPYIVPSKIPSSTELRGVTLTVPVRQ